MRSWTSFQGEPTHAQEEACQRPVGSSDAIRTHSVAIALVYPAIASLWLIALFAIADNALSLSAGWVIFWSALLASPHALLSAQRAHVRRADTLRHWRDGSWWHKFLSGASFRPATSWLFTTALMFGLVVHAAIDEELVWLITATAVVLPVGVWVTAKSMRGSLKAPWLSFWPVTYGVWLTVAIVLLGSIFLSSQPENAPANLSAARALFPCYEGNSALMDVVFEITTFTAAIMSYGFALAQSTEAEWGTGFWIFTFLSQAGLVAVVAYSLVAFLLPRAQIRLGFKTVGEDPDSPKDTSRRLFAQQGAAVVGLSVAGHWAVNEAEQFALDHHLPLLTQTGTLMVEQIDGGSYPVGTIAFLEKIDHYGSEMVKKAIRMADQEIVKAFAQARGSVDAYLDWHFSLKADAARAIGLDTIANGLAQKLGLANLQSKADSALARLDGATKGLGMLQSLVDDTLKTQKIASRTNRSRHAIRTTSVDLIPTLIEFREPIAFNTRVSVAGAVVSVGGLSGALLGRYIVRKGAVRGATSVAGLSVGSVLPVLGTAAGALIGFALGALVDWSLLKYNEKVERSNMRRQLLVQLTTGERGLRRYLADLLPKGQRSTKPQVEPRCEMTPNKAQE